MDENTPHEQPPYRWPTNAAEKRINALLRISEDQYSQDWEFEISDSARLPEYLEIYENQLANEDERFALMSVIIDAFDTSDLDEAMWCRIRAHLKAEFEVHQHTIFYWCVMEEEHYDPELENWFYITARMRELWYECKANPKMLRPLALNATTVHTLATNKPGGKR